jgi:hypothetical protein
MSIFGKSCPVVVAEYALFLVPDERIELPTNGLQNRCSTAELIRLARPYSIDSSDWGIGSSRFPGMPADFLVRWFCTIQGTGATSLLADGAW